MEPGGGGGGGWKDFPGPVRTSIEARRPRCLDVSTRRPNTVGASAGIWVGQDSAMMRTCEHLAPAFHEAKPSPIGHSVGLSIPTRGELALSYQEEYWVVKPCVDRQTAKLG